MTKAKIELTKDQLEILIWILDDWRTMKSDGNIAVQYPSNAISSTQLINLLFKIYEKL